jgi:hypothetical protein
MAAEAESQRSLAQRSRQEQKQRDVLLEKYGFETNAVDEEGNIIVSETPVSLSSDTR